jgi:hypothetical protein
MKFHYHLQKSPPLVLILNQMHTFHMFPHSIPKKHSNVISSSTPRSSKWSLPFRFSDQSTTLLHRHLELLLLRRSDIITAVRRADRPTKKIYQALNRTMTNLQYLTTMLVLIATPLCSNPKCPTRKLSSNVCYAAQLTEDGKKNENNNKRNIITGCKMER